MRENGRRSYKLAAFLLSSLFILGVASPLLVDHYHNSFSTSLTLVIYGLGTQNGQPQSKQGTVVNLTILYTSDIHSQLLPWPVADYKSGMGNDDTLGGFARLATLIDQIRGEKQSVSEPVLLFDGGDFLMGTPFQYLGPNSTINASAELVMMKELGYNATCIGNHEFDYSDHGLSLLFNHTNSTLSGDMPLILCSNLVWTTDYYGLGEFIKNNVTFTVTSNSETVRVGVFAVVGYNANSTMFFKGHYNIKDPIETAREEVAYFKSQNVDIIVMISHSGYLEDMYLASQVPGIDLILAAHDHKLLTEPITVFTALGNTTIIDVKSYGEYLGKLELSAELGHAGQGVRVRNYTAIHVNDTILEKDEIVSALDPYIAAMNDTLNDLGLPPYDTIIAYAGFNITHSSPGVEHAGGESAMGDLVADAMRWAISNITGEYVDFAFEPSGHIKHSKYFQMSGNITVYDAVSVISLGGVPFTGPYLGWPLCSFYLYGYEIKRVLEMTLAMGGDFFLQISGLRYTYTPLGIPGHKVISIERLTQDGKWVPLDTSPSNTQLYRVGCNLEAVLLVPQLGEMYPMFKITLKNSSGDPVSTEETIVHNNSAPVPDHVGFVKFLSDYLNGTVPNIYNSTQNRVRVWQIDPFLLFAMSGVGQLLVSQSNTFSLTLGGIACILLIMVVAAAAILTKKP